jgi:hypothetical protein
VKFSQEKVRGHPRVERRMCALLDLLDARVVFLSNLGQRDHGAGVQKQ